MKEEFVRRFDCINNSVNTKNPLSIGNGNFCFTADITGLQTFKALYTTIPLLTMTNRIWAGNPSNANLELTDYKSLSGRRIGYSTSSKNLRAYNELRENMFKFNLFSLAFYYENKLLDVNNLSDINQRLDLYHGELYSEFKYLDQIVMVKTLIYADKDFLAISIVSPLLAKGLQVRLLMNNPAPNKKGEDDNIDGLYTQISGNSITRITSKIKYDFYFKTNGYNPKIKNADIVFETANEDLYLALSLQNNFKTMGDNLAGFWTKTQEITNLGYELEKRTVLSLYLLRINCLGVFPPSETGLTMNSWYGKFHLEMHPIHLLGLIKFGHAKEVFDSLKYYLDIAKDAKLRAIKQGYSGARWPKMTDPNGQDSPSPIGPLLVWQQPHLILMLEAIFNELKDIAVYEKFQTAIVDTLEFMRSFLVLKDGSYYLDKPLLSMQECYPDSCCDSPLFETEYFRYIFAAGTLICKKLGLENDYSDYASKLVKPNIKNNLYYPMQNNTDCYQDYNNDHPMVVGAYSLIKSSEIDIIIMRNTLQKVLDCWDYSTLWGWDFPMLAMTAMNLDDYDLAKSILLTNAPKNTYLKNGHNMQGDREDLPLYLPGNGLFLLAIYEYNKHFI